MCATSPPCSTNLRGDATDERNRLIAADFGRQLVGVLGMDEYVIVGPLEILPAELRARFDEICGDTRCPPEVRDYVEKISACTCTPVASESPSPGGGGANTSEKPPTLTDADDKPDGSRAPNCRSALPTRPWTLSELPITRTGGVAHVTARGMAHVTAPVMPCNGNCAHADPVRYST